MKHYVVAAIVALLAAFASKVALADPPALQMFANGAFQPGRYEVRALDGDSKARGDMGPQCIADVGSLSRAGVSAANCTHTIIDDEADRATLTYSCRGVGSGRTTIFREGPGLFILDAQGVRNSEPFASRAEYRRTGDCG